MLAEVARVVQPGGLFYVGLYGGEDFEGHWEEDPSGQARFFAYYSDEAIRNAVEIRGMWAVESFKRVETGIERGSALHLHFQSLVLRSLKIPPS